MIKKILISVAGILLLAFGVIYFLSKPTLEEDGSYSPSSLALNLGTVSVSDYEEVKYTKYEGEKSKILIIFTENKNLEMKNGKLFSTGNHPIEALVPMLHLKNAGFEFNIVTPNGNPVVFEMWAFPNEDENVKAIYQEYKSNFDNPGNLSDFIASSFANDSAYAAVFIPGGHGAMNGIPENRNVAKTLNWAHNNDLFTITLCHGPGSLLSTTLDNQEFTYKGYKMAVFPDAVDEMTPMVGYLPGHMKAGVSDRLKNLGAIIVNTQSDNTTVRDRDLITGASPLASNELGKLAASTLLEEL